jgi:hypothetical protein
LEVSKTSTQCQLNFCSATTTKTVVVQGFADGTCIPSENVMCLGNGRFEVSVDYRSDDGEGKARVVSGVGTADSGLFFFFNKDNWELLVKVIDGCDITNHFWVFSAATTNLGYDLIVTDTRTEDQVIYTNPINTSGAAVTDTSALATCDAP